MNFVGIDLPELIRLKHRGTGQGWTVLLLRRDRSAWIDTISWLLCLDQPCKLWSGLICLNWYDWNNVITITLLGSSLGRDWSAWIDTIETVDCFVLISHASYGRDWSAWIDTIETHSAVVYIPTVNTSGLICLNWYDWNSDTLCDHASAFISVSGLICLNWYDWNW